MAIRDPETLWYEWDDWQSYLAGDEGEDLLECLSRVRLGAVGEARVEWANDERTRDFCDLGLHLIYGRHGRRDASASLGESRLFRSLRPDDLVNYAAIMIRGQARAERLTKDRWQRTWGNQGAFSKELIAYLYRPNLTRRRIEKMRLPVVEMARHLPLGEVIRRGTMAELQSACSYYPLGLAVIIESTLHTHPDIRPCVISDRELRAELWAGLYERMCSVYGVQRRDGSRGRQPSVYRASMDVGNNKRPRWTQWGAIQKTRGPSRGRTA